MQALATSVRTQTEMRTYIHCMYCIMVTFLSYISNACHSLSGAAEWLQHTLHLSAARGWAVARWMQWWWVAPGYIRLNA